MSKANEPTDLQRAAEFIEEELERRKAGGGWTPCMRCRGLGILSAEDDAPDCHFCDGTGQVAPPYITAAEDALAAVRRVREGVARVQAKKLDIASGPTRFALGWALHYIDTSKSVTTEERPHEQSRPLRI